PVSEGSAATGDPGATAMLYLGMEVAGCPTVCRHCWAQGTGYGVMPLSDIEWVLEEAHRFCGGRGVGFDAYPMHEVAAHPDATRLFGLFNSRDHRSACPAPSCTVAGGHGRAMWVPTATFRCSRFFGPLWRPDRGRHSSAFHSRIASRVIIEGVASY